MIKGKIIRIIDTRNVVINVGKSHGVKRGAQFGIYTPSEDIVDPETNAVLGPYRELKATVEARSVYQLFSIGSPPRRTFSLADALPNIPPRADLPVDPNQVHPLPTGKRVRVGDVVEEIPSLVLPPTSPTTRPPTGS